MVRLLEGTWLISVSDVWAYHQCPQAFINRVDAARGLAELATPPEQPLRRLMGDVLAEHRARLIRDLSHRTSQVTTIPRPQRDGVGPDGVVDSWQDGSHATDRALREGADVIIGPVFAEKNETSSPTPVVWVGGVDLAVKSPRFAPDVDQDEHGWELWEAKLGASQTGKTLMRLAAFADYLSRRGVTTTNRARIVFANGPDSLRGIHKAQDNWIATKHRLMQDLTHHLAGGGVLSWPDETIDACGRKTCGWCSNALGHHDDIFHLPGVTAHQRHDLRKAGFSTMTDFVEASRKEVADRVPDVGTGILDRLHLQATLLTLARRHPTTEPPWQLVNPGGLRALPDRSPHDLFVDFEADPTYREWSVSDPYFPIQDSGHPRWWLGLDYLIGIATWTTTEAGEDFVGLWADDFAGEERIFRQFLELVEQMRSLDSSAHVYHYAPYEMVALHRLAKRYQCGSGQIAQWEKQGVFVDLYRIFTQSIAAGLPNYSLKSVERLFLEPHTRDTITGGAQSVESIHELNAHTQHGRLQEAEACRVDIVNYNRQDTLSTRQLAVWLSERKKEI